MYRWNSGVHQPMRSNSLIPVILRVYVDDDTVCEVPITPESTWQDVVECCRDPGEELCHLVELWRGYERPVRDVERPFAVLQDWGAHRDEVFFCLRSTPSTQLDDNPSFPTSQEPNGPGVQQNSRQRSGKRNGMKEPTTVSDELPDGVELTLSELQEMATRQQQQIESQQQMLVVKEQRLKFLKQQESQHQQVSAESERLQRLREKMEAQETKLRKLRALWGQVDQQRMNNTNLTSELDTIRALFNEKEKELSVAVAKVDELTKQLEELRRGRANGTNMAGQRTSPAAVELEKLRRELLYHNKLNEQQNMKLAEQREALDQKQEEMLRIDKRIAELQQRLNKKRMLNQQLANQINTVSATKPVANATASQPLPTATTTATTTCLAVGGMVQGRAVNRTVGNSSARVPGHAQGPAGRVPASGGGGVVSGVPVNLLHRPLAPNVAQVEPYQHTPKEAVVLPKEPSVSQPQDDLHAKLKEDSTLGFQPNKNDPKYQTLPYNTKFSVKFGKVEPVVQPVFAADGDDKLDKLVVVDEKPQVPLSEGAANGRNVTNGSKGTNSHLAPQTVHSTPAYTPARGQATAVLQMACTGVVASRVSSGGSQQQVASNNLVPQSTNGHRTSSQMISAPGSRSQYDTGQRSGVASTAAAVTVTSAPSSAAPASVTNVAIMAPQLTQPLTHAQPLPALDPSVELKVSSIAPEKHNGNNKAGILYHQTSSTRVQPPIPHTFSTTPQGLLREVEELAASKSQGKESPPEPAVVETNSPESPNCPSNVPKPALPPKPNIPSKPTPPPRQLHAVDTSPDAVDSAISILRGSGKQVGNIPFSSSDSPAAGLPKKSTNNVLDQYLKSMSQMYGRVGEPLTENPNVQQHDSVVVQETNADNSSSQRKTHPNDLPIKPKPLTIKKNAALEPPKLKGASLTPPTASPSAPMSTAIITSPANGTVPTKTITALQGNGNRSSGSSSAATAGVHVSISRRIEMPPAFLFPENETQLAADANNGAVEQNDSNNNSSANNVNNNNGTDRSVNAKNLQLSCDVTDNLAAVHFGGVSEADKTWDLATTNKQKAGAKRPVVDGGPADVTVNTQGPRTEGEGSCEPSSTGSQAYLEETSSQIVQSVDIVHAEQIVNSEIHQIVDQEGTVVEVNSNLENVPVEEQLSSHVANVVRRAKKGNLKTKGSVKNARRVSFDPLALLLDASLEGELELVKKTAKEVTNPSAANDEGITALHNAICAGHYEIVKFLVEFGCDVNAQDSDGWTPLHCAASCNNLPMVKFLVEHGACIFATTLSDQETAAEKCEEEEEGFDGCSEYLYSIQEKLGILNSGVVYALYNYDARNADELSFRDSEVMVVLRKGDDLEREWWWSKLKDREGYIPRNLLGLYPRVVPSNDQ